MSRPRTALYCPANSLLVAFCLVALASGPSRANVNSAVATQDSSDCAEADIQAQIQTCIQANKTTPPPGNPGPFVRGYGSIVVLTGQCFGGGLSGLTSIGDNIVFGAAAAGDKESSWVPGAGGASTAKYLWFDKLIQEINANANRNLKDVLDAVNTANPDPGAGSPPPTTSTGGGTVKLGDPANTGVGSYHAVLFAGYRASGTSDDAIGQNAAAQKELDDMSAALQAKCHIPAANIDSRFSGTCDDLKAMIAAAWTKMNDNEQFILVLGDHGVQDIFDKTASIQPDPNTGGQKSSLDTPESFASSNVTQPHLVADAQHVFQPGTVMVNGLPIGSMPPSTGHERIQFRIPPGILNPVGGPANLVQFTSSAPQSPLNYFSMNTGPVAARSAAAALPGPRRFALALLCFAMAASGALAIRQIARGRATR